MINPVANGFHLATQTQPRLNHRLTRYAFSLWRGNYRVKPMFLRPFRPTDKRHLQQLFFDTVHSLNGHDFTPAQLDVWAPAEPHREIWSRLDEQSCFVVEFQKLVVGFASLSDDGMITFLIVHKNFQGRGIASTLLKQLERVARKKGFESLKAESCLSASGFFKKLGFELLSENRRQIQGQELLTFNMEKTLPLLATNNTKT